MECKKHPLRKRKDCPDCQAEAVQAKPIVVKPKPAETAKSLKDVIAPKKAKPKEDTVEIIEIKKEEAPIELGKSLKDDISEYIRKEVKKTVVAITEELISQEAREAAKRVASEAMERAIESYKWKVKELSDVQHEHLAVPLSSFRMTMLDKLSSEGWKMVQSFTGEVAKVSGYRCDVVIFSRVKNPKWPKAPEYKV